MREPRRATLGDMEAVAQLHRHSFFHAMPHMPELHDEAQMVFDYLFGVFSELEIWLVEDDKGGVAGFISFRPGEVVSLYVHPELQGRGIGSVLLKLPMGIASEVRLWTFQCNAKARRFYEKHGFTVERETDGAENEEKQPDMLYVWRCEG